MAVSRFRAFVGQGGFGMNEKLSQVVLACIKAMDSLELSKNKDNFCLIATRGDEFKCPYLDRFKEEDLAIWGKYFKCTYIRKDTEQVR